MSLRAGIDVGGTKCLGVVVDDDGTVVRHARRPTPKGPDAIITTLVKVAGELAPFDSIGVGVPGLITRTGVIRASPNLFDIAEFEVGPWLSRELGYDVAVDNDATCAAAAEWKFGAAKGV